MENNNLPINSSSIVNILTLRYDQNLRPNLPIKTWDDFNRIYNQQILISLKILSLIT